MASQYQNIIAEQDNSICIITIQRESKLNALNRETLNELHHALVDALKNADVKGVILTGAGEKAFVAGADIAEFLDSNHNDGQNMAREGQSKVFDLVNQASKPIIAASNGFALGGGLELALACHIR